MSERHTRRKVLNRVSAMTIGGAALVGNTSAIEESDEGDNHRGFKELKKLFRDAAREDEEAGIDPNQMAVSDEQSELLKLSNGLSPSEKLTLAEEALTIKVEEPVASRSSPASGYDFERERSIVGQYSAFEYSRTVWRYHLDVSWTRGGQNIVDLERRYYPHITTLGQSNGWEARDYELQDESGGVGEMDYSAFVTAEFAMCVQGCINENHVWIDFDASADGSTDTEYSHNDPIDT
ncbi:hypothetical protein [Halovivax sp.]|uniref:hypothetical protein n=1 Tax=Halovivax sp. TaxID=1935978 RepID=UPI0025C6F836|nr:hypothetical protein [Halovivax sp.]